MEILLIIMLAPFAILVGIGVIRMMMSPWTWAAMAGVVVWLFLVSLGRY
jgi:hypothetical protein